MPAELVLVTGASGFLGSHIVDLLLKKGYRVRAIARGAKVEELNKINAHLGDQFEAISVTDIVSDEFPEALKGVAAVIHTAAPLPTRAEPEVILNGAIQGTLNVVVQAQKAGIKKIIVTSSIVSVLNPANSFTDKDWNPTTKETALKGSNMNVYMAAKTLAERALWEFSDAHPDIDVTTFNPPFLYGPFSRSYSLPALNYGALSTNLYIYQLLTPNGPYPISPGHSDVRDIARAHVLALTAPPESDVGRKRILIASPHDLKFEDVVALIASKRPELKDRLVDPARAPKFPIYRAPIDPGRAEEVLGFKRSEYSAWEDTILRTVDDLVAIEKNWKAKGYEVQIPLE